jgi:hypothetical protein
MNRTDGRRDVIARAEPFTESVECGGEAPPVLVTAKGEADELIDWQSLVDEAEKHFDMIAEISRNNERESKKQGKDDDADEYHNEIIMLHRGFDCWYFAHRQLRLAARRPSAEPASHADSWTIANWAKYGREDETGVIHILSRDELAETIERFVQARAEAVEKDLQWWQDHCKDWEKSRDEEMARADKLEAELAALKASGGQS